MNKQKFEEMNKYFDDFRMEMQNIAQEDYAKTKEFDNYCKESCKMCSKLYNAAPEELKPQITNIYDMFKQESIRRARAMYKYGFDDGIKLIQMLFN